MKRARRLALPALLAVLVSAFAAEGAVAFYGNAAGTEGAELVSADYDRLEQGDDSTIFAAISADGRYVAFQTAARNFFADDDPDPPGQYRRGGIFRFDLETRALEKVADGDLLAEDGADTFVRRGAFSPSISADGRFVAFVSGQRLVGADVNDNLDVYVRDVSLPEDAPGAFDLVSARDGGDVPATYGPPSEPFPGSEPGAAVTRGVAISADGQKVVFRTDAASDLPAAPAAETPAGQVYVRDRVAETTTLVTAKRNPGTGEMTAEPAGGAIGAGLSADGTTAIWTGANAGEQTPILNGENADPSFLYYLWRRIADGAAAPTRRVTGLADPDDPACPPAAETVFDQVSTGPCYGPLTDQEANRSGVGEQPPAISGDGYTVAFLTGSGLRESPFSGAGLDLFVTDMREGLTRKQATVELTRDPGTFDPSTSSAIGGIAMTADARYIALTSVRNKFTLPALSVLGPMRTTPDARELLVVDLRERTIERVTESAAGGEINASVLDGATISGDGGRVAFASFAGNHFFGDSNQRPDAFVATRLPDPGAGVLDEGLGDDGAGTTIEVDREGPRIGVRARSRPGGAVLVTVSVPAAGGVKAVARAAVGEPRKPRTLADESARAPGGGRSQVSVLLRPVVRYRAELKERGTIRGRVAVTYVASQGGRRASASIRVAFRDFPAARTHTRNSKK